MKTLIIVVTSVLTLGSFAVAAQDQTSPPPVDREKLKAEHARARPEKVQPFPLGDYPTRPGDPGYRPKLTPAEREAAAQKAAAKSELRQNGLRWQMTP